MWVRESRLPFTAPYSKRFPGARDAFQVQNHPETIFLSKAEDVEKEGHEGHREPAFGARVFKRDNFIQLQNGFLRGLGF